MPRSPAFLGNLVDIGLGRRADVLSSTEPAPGFLEIGLRADPPTGGWHPGHEVQFRVTPTEGRRYTVHTVGGEHDDHLGILAATHANGPGTDWLRALRSDARITVLAGRFAPLRGDRAGRLHLGDGSSIGTIDASARTADQALVVVEVPSIAVAPLSGRFAGYRFIASADEPGDALQDWLEDDRHRDALRATRGALLLGHAQSIQRQRRFLVDGRYLERRAITTRPYWATGRRGL
jgi:NADPH-dependent ferric siderophore reductase